MFSKAPTPLRSRFGSGFRNKAPTPLRSRFGSGFRNKAPTPSRSRFGNKCSAKRPKLWLTTLMAPRILTMCSRSAVDGKSIRKVSLVLPGSSAEVTVTSTRTWSHVHLRNGPHQCGTCFGPVQASNTRSRGASKTRVKISSRSDAALALALLTGMLFLVLKLLAQVGV